MILKFQMILALRTGQNAIRIAQTILLLQIVLLKVVIIQNWCNHYKFQIIILNLYGMAIMNLCNN